MIEVFSNLRNLVFDNTGVIFLQNPQLSTYQTCMLMALVDMVFPGSLLYHLAPMLQKDFFYNLINRYGLKICFSIFFVGLLLWMNTFWNWKALNFGALDYSMTLKSVIPGATLISLSFEMLIFILFNSWSKIEIT